MARISRRDLSRFEEGARLGRLRQMLEDPTEILEGIGNALVAESRKAFREQRMGSVEWKSRGETKMNPNWPAILADMEQGRQPPERRFRDRPALIDTGTLRRSVTYHVVARADMVEAGSNLPYAGPLHAGEETETVKITRQVQMRLKQWIGSRRSRHVAAAQSLRWLTRPFWTDKRIGIDHPARPIVGLPDSLVDDIERMIGIRIRRRSVQP